MEEDPRPYFADRQSAIKRLPVKPALRPPAFPHQIPAYRKRDLSSVVDRCGVEVVGQISCNILRRKGIRGKSVQQLYDACVMNGKWSVKKMTPKIYYCEILMKL
jgi:hypothetical protein